MPSMMYALSVRNKAPKSPANIQAAQELSEQMLALDEIRNPWKKTWNTL